MTLSTVELPATAHKSILDYIEDNLQLGGWYYDFALERGFWSQRLYSLLGLGDSRATPSLELFLSVVHPEDRGLVDDGEVLKRAGPLGLRRFRIIRPNGAIRWIEASGQLLHRADGVVWRAIGCARDITDEHEALLGNAAKEGMRQAVRKLTGGEVWITGPGGVGAEPFPWLGTLIRQGMLRHDAVHPDDVMRVRGAWAKALAERRPFHLSYRLSTAAGRYESYTCYAEPIQDERRQPLGWVGISLPDNAAPAGDMTPARNIPGALLRAARGWLNLSVIELAERSGLSSSTIRRLEGGGGRQATRDSEETLLRTFHEAGIDFYVDGGGRPQVRFSDLPSGRQALRA